MSFTSTMDDRPTDDRMYRALIDREAAFEGIFMVGVKTTGIFCRPTCSARKPKRENVEFFPTAREALSAGYRACQRCTPLEPGLKSQHKLVRKLMARVRSAPLDRITDADLRCESMDPSTVRRQFKASIGMTFQAYQRAERLGRAFRLLRSSTGSSLQAANEAGYDSISGFADAFTALFGIGPGQADQASTLSVGWIETPLGPMVSIAHDEGIVLLEFCDRRALEREVQRLRARFASTIVPTQHPHLDQLKNELAAYFAGDMLGFSTPLHMVGSAFQIDTWEQLRSIPPGQTRSYSEQAEAIGRPNAARAVGRANGENRIAILIPCHRVIGSNGALVGYGGGIWRKRWLLHHEVSHAGAPVSTTS